MVRSLWLLLIGMDGRFPAPVQLGFADHTDHKIKERIHHPQPTAPLQPTGGKHSSLLFQCPQFHHFRHFYFTSLYFRHLGGCSPLFTLLSPLHFLWWKCSKCFVATCSDNKIARVMSSPLIYEGIMSCWIFKLKPWED
jgi:hypothetical protein